MVAEWTLGYGKNRLQKAILERSETVTYRTNRNSRNKMTKHLQHWLISLYYCVDMSIKIQGLSNVIISKTNEYGILC